LFLLVVLGGGLYLRSYRRVFAVKPLAQGCQGAEVGSAPPMAGAASAGEWREGPRPASVHGFRASFSVAEQQKNDPKILLAPAVHLW
jgi:hypothetical protein